jgi:hypothetical protein
MHVKQNRISVTATQHADLRGCDVPLRRGDRFCLIPAIVGGTAPNARRDQEMLIFQHVPTEAIVGHWPGR